MSLIQFFQGGHQSIYQLNEIHFRWGSKDTRGSEHTINGVSLIFGLRSIQGGSE